jgi:hypothetical protein
MGMDLFGNRLEANLRSCVQMVEAVLEARGSDPSQCRIHSAGGPAWGLHYGSAEVFVLLTSGTEENFIQVVAPVMRPTATDVALFPLFRRLLQLNADELTGAAFGFRDDEVVISSDRSTDGLDRVEVEEMIRRVAEYANHFDDALTEEFGGTRHGDLKRGPVEVP